MLTLKLTNAEVNHLLIHLYNNGQMSNTDYDWYYGNKEHFVKRHKQLKKKLEDTI